MSELCAPDSERSILGSVLLNNHLMSDAEVTVDDFAASANRAIFRAILEQWSEGQPFDPSTIALTLNGQRENVGGLPYIDSLTDGAVPDAGIIKVHCRKLRELSQRRKLAALGEQLSQSETGNLSYLIQRAQKTLRSLEAESAPASSRIRARSDIPDILTMQIPKMDYVVPSLGIGGNTITLYTGADGDGKTYVAQAMSLAVARGDMFLGSRCQKTSTLYLDLENPASAVQERMQALLGDDANTPDLKIWGQWNDPPAPQAGSELLLSIAKESPSLLIVDPFRYFHNGDENDSTEMAGVMQYLRALAAAGCAVVILHHPSKTEGSTGRGSSVIRAACDLAFLHTLDRESGLITLKVDKNRFGASRTFTIRADFEEGIFEMTDAPYITRRNDELQKLEDIIRVEPGISQNGIFKKTGGNRNRVTRLLNEGETQGQWMTEKGKHGAKCYKLVPEPVSNCGNSLYSKNNTSDIAVH
jgi:AAA domain/DnaB-like helicase N terminal domain